MPFAIDRFKLTGVDFAKGAAGLMGGFVCHGSFVAVAPGVDLDELRNGCRAMLSGFGDVMAGVSALPGENGISARILAREAVTMNAALQQLADIARLALVGARPGRRRK